MPPRDQPLPLLRPQLDARFAPQFGALDFRHHATSRDLPHVFAFDIKRVRQPRVVERPEQGNSRRADCGTRQAPGRYEQVTGLHFVALLQLHFAVVKHEDAVRGGDFDRAVVARRDLIHRLVMIVTDHGLERTEARRARNRIETDHTVAAGDSTLLEAIVNELADLNELGIATVIDDQSRLITRYAHQDDLVIAQLLDVEVGLADAGAERGDQRFDLAVREHLVEAGLFDVEDFALEREDRLRAAVSSPFRAIVNEDATGQSEIMRSRHFKIVNIDALVKPFNLDGAMVVISHRFNGERLVAVKITLAESPKLQ